MERLLAALLFALVLCLPSPAVAQFGLIQQGLDAVTSGKKAAEPAGSGGSAAKGGSGGGAVLASDTTFKNPARGFEFTIPAGWKLESGDPASESVLFMKPGTTFGFQFHLEQMVPSFPRKASVEASLKQAKEMVGINKYLEAKRRDDGDAKKKCGVIGWEIVEAPQKNDYQRIIWQAYDGENYYMNFMAHSENKDFATARPVLRQIMDSIKFCR
ncbi:hypothetical protein GTA51_17065 [Desulfovibrio aerotolerans]|uniref:PsbP C-terminal domain-containing protein n=1 Tax=Solidesulfovibrio aerotolerans TaxID=295255 RepID=A0A7C9IP55_9BACT|nr:hypothetical protein [Solidesulfovibrio aerotolerans]MYL84826.1 hypothetical protein [Solidesulfovibrio aerotolerans]